MPTASETSLDEARRWTDLASSWTREQSAELWDDRPPTERAVVVFFDPVSDLRERASRWGHDLVDSDLSSLGLFAAALANVEAQGWESGKGDVATRAYEARRFLVGDRILHWAVPWLDAIGRCYPRFRDKAHRDRDFLLDLADEMRVAPAIAGKEGLVAEGEDSYGPLERRGGHDRWITSLWSGLLILDATRASLQAENGDTGDLSLLYEVASHRWLGMADRHPGSAQIWTDLGERALSTSRCLTG